MPTWAHQPPGEHESAAAEAVDLAALAGLHLLPWQRLVLERGMAERVVAGQPQWAAFEVGIEVGRQNGKGAILEARQLAGLFLLNERLQIHTAHEFKTCFEHFRRVVDLVDGTDEFRKRVKIIRTGAGDQAIELRNGCRLRFLARSRSSGRGFSGDTVYLDEAFQLEPSVMGALLPSLSARPNPQLWYTSSAPHKDSTVLHSVRKRAMQGGEPRLYYASWSNHEGVDPLDREAWARANPSLGYLIDERFVESEQRAMTAAEFARERLGVAEEPVGVGNLPIPVEAWDACVDHSSSPTDPVVFAVDASPDRSVSSIVVAARRTDGAVHVEVVDSRPGVSWIAPAIAQLVAAWAPSAVVVESRSPALSELSALEASGADVVKVSPAVYAAHCGGFRDRVLEQTVRHRGDGQFRTALGGLRSRKVGESLFSWSRADATCDITPIVAATLAVGQLPQSAPPAKFWIY